MSKSVGGLGTMRYRIEAINGATIAVKVTDMLGEEVLVVKAV